MSIEISWPVACYLQIIQSMNFQSKLVKIIIGKAATSVLVCWRKDSLPYNKIRASQSKLRTRNPKSLLQPIALSSTSN